MSKKSLCFHLRLVILIGIISLFYFNFAVALPQYNYQYPTTRTTYYYTNLTNVTNIYNVGLNGTGSATQMCYFSDTDYVSGATGTSWDDTNKILSIIKDGYSFSFTNRYVKLMSASGEDSFLELGSDGNGGWSLVNRGSDYKAGLCSTSGGSFAFQCELEIDSNGNANVSGSLTSPRFTGDGSRLTNLTDAKGLFAYKMHNRTRFDRIQIAGQTGGSALSATGFGTHVLYAIPHEINRNSEVLNLSVMPVALGSVGCIVNLGIYDSYPDETYPRNLIAQTGNTTSLNTTGMRSLPVNVNLSANNLYFFVYWLSSGAYGFACSGLTTRSIPVAGTTPIYGVNNTFGETVSAWGIQASYSSSVMPNTYPSNGTIANLNTAPAIGIIYDII